MPRSTFLFKNIFANKSFKQTVHKYCCYSQKCLGVKVKAVDQVTNVKNFVCPYCKEQSNSCNLNNEFLTFELKSQVIIVIKNNQELLLAGKDRPPGDITNGAMYKKITGNVEAERIVTLTINLYGIQPIKSKRKTLRPILGIINELHPSKRFESYNKIFAALWYDKKQPEMRIFFKVLCDEIKELSRNGINLNVNGEKTNFKIIILICALDSPAKSKLLCQNQHNGYYSRPHCLQKGICVSNNNVKYPYEYNIEQRTSRFIRKQMLKCAEEQKEINPFTFFGYKGLLLCMFYPFSIFQAAL